MTDNKQLREAAEAAIELLSKRATMTPAEEIMVDFGLDDTMERFDDLSNPSTVLGLLDEIDHLNRMVKMSGKASMALAKSTVEGVDEASELKAQIATLTAERDAMREALKPFVKLANSEHYSTLALGEGIDHWPVNYTEGLVLGDLRRAAKAGGTE